MNQIATSKPTRVVNVDRALIELERSESFTTAMDEIRAAIRNTPAPNLIYQSEIRAFAKTPSEVTKLVDRGLERQRKYLTSLPAQETVRGLQRRVDQITAVKTEAGIRRQIALLLGAYPNGRPADPEVYVNMILFDLIDMGFCDAIVSYACQDLRRSQNFLPTVAEVVAAARSRNDTWTFEIPRQISRIEEVRQALINAMEHNERMRDEVLRSMAEERKESFA